MIALRSPEETLVLVPHIVGYRPARQLVLCGLDQRVVDASGQRACMGPVVVVDCAAESVGEDHARFIAEVVGHHRVTKAVIVLYCDDLAQVEGTAAARLEHVHAMALQALAPAPDGFLASYAVDGTSFVRVDGSEATVRSLRELDSCQAAAELVYKGSSPLREPPSPEIEAKPEAERDAALEKLRRRAVLEKELMLARERARAAHELHDGLGHRLTRIGMSLEFAGRVRDSDPDAAWEEVAVAERTSREAVREMRTWVRALSPVRAEDDRGVASLEDVAASFRGTGVRVRVTDELTGAAYEWSGQNYVRLDPFEGRVAHVFRVEPLTKPPTDSR